MRIALLHPCYWPEVRRGSERLLHDIGVGLAARGHEVTILTSHRGPPSAGMEEGVRVVRSWRPPIGPLHYRHLELFWSNVPAAFLRLSLGKFDVAHAFFHVDAWTAVRAQLRGGPPVVMSFMGIPTRQFIVGERWRLRMLADAVRGAAAVTVLSEAAAGPFHRYLLRRPEVVPGGVDTERFAVGAPRAREPTLVCAASLDDPRKRGGLLLRAFARIRERLPAARLLLAGRPPPRGPALPDGASWVDGDDVAALARAYASAWASVLPAVGEAFGLVLVESLAAGTPAIAACDGGCPEILDDPRLGWLFEPDDEPGLVTAMEEALESGHDGTRAELCRARALAYDWSQVLPSYEAILERAARL